MLDILLDCVVDALKVLPFLFLSYLVVEYAEHRMSGRTKQMIYRAGKAGPLIGSLVGILPQCGFSAAAAGLYAGGMVSPGTLLAVFLSTSDEMLPIMVSEGISAGIIGKVLLCKVAAGTVIGLLVDLAAEAIYGKRSAMPEHPHMCEHDHCGCGEHGIFRSAVSHTVRTAAFLFAISLVIAFAMDWFDVSGASHSIVHVPVIGEAIAALIGLIPNCAASVLITELYLENIIAAGPLLAGLLCGAGTGLLVLYRENRSVKQNAALTAILYVTGTLAGLLIGRLGIF